MHKADITTICQATDNGATKNEGKTTKKGGKTTMSDAYKEKLDKDGTVNMRSWCQRPGKKDENGYPIYMTQQHQKEQCDINLIIKRATAGEVITHVNTFEEQFGDATGADFKDAMDFVTNAQNAFNELPSKIRARFDNNAEKLLQFMEDPGNREEAISLGLIDKDRSIDTDGLGEHVDGKVVKPKKKEKQPPTKMETEE